MEILEGFSFNNEIFFFVFSLIFLANIILYDFNVVRKLFLTVISLFFFIILSHYELLPLAVLLAVIFINFAGGLFLKQYKSKIILFFLILSNVCLLFFIKYPFLFDFINAHIFIIGISFFILNNISFLIDSFHGKIISNINIFDFMLFSLYFPKILIGPLVRYNEFYFELNHNSNFPNIDIFYSGLFLFMLGLMKKMGADYISMLPMTIQSNPLGYTGFDHITAMYGYTIYIYLDFSGYSDIAVGLSLLLGIELTQNFRYPYLSSSIKDFWRRWHISLSLWIKDYIYVPLGGNKKGRYREYINISLAFIVSGLWHGLGFNFFVWSLIHSFGIIFNKMTFGMFKLGYINNLLTFHLVALSWIFFANSYDNAIISLNKIVFEPAFADVYAIIMNNIEWYIIFIIMILGVILEERISGFLRSCFIKSNYLIKACVIFFVIYLMVVSKQNTIKPFVYQQF